jgi:hypothetical protein
MTDVSGEEIATRGLKIIGAGFGRTGTLSLKMALNELGFGPCYHMTEVFSHPEHIPMWEAAARGEPIDWNAIFADYQSTVDWPACDFYKELLQAYPDAKVLLSVRDAERWYESVESTIYGVSRRSPRFATAVVISFVMRQFIPNMRKRMHMLNALIWNRTFEGKFEDKDFAIAVFNRHNEEVQHYVPAEKLLVYNVKEGWEPLCAFLGVPVPHDEPFPHLNDRDSFVGNTRIRQVERVSNIILVSGVLAALLLIIRLLPVARLRKSAK